MAQKLEIMENNQKQILFLMTKTCDSSPDKDWKIQFSTMFPLQDIQSLNQLEERLATDDDFKQNLVRPKIN